MGKLSRIAELEKDSAYWRKRAEIHDEIKSYFKTLAEMPDDAVLLYTLTGQRMSHSIGKSARILLEKFYG